MPDTFLIETQTAITPVVLAFGVRRVSVGAKCIASRTTKGLILVSIRRGDGANPETYPISVDHRIYGPFTVNEEAVLTLAAIDMLGAGSYPRTYQLRVVALDGGHIRVREARIGTAPYSRPGILAL